MMRFRKKCETYSVGEKKKKSTKARTAHIFPFTMVTIKGLQEISMPRNMFILLWQFLLSVILCTMP